MSRAPHVLIVAGSDCSGGAGIARDIATLAHFGIRASLAVTAITVQTDSAVLVQQPVAAWLVARQMRAAIDANPVAAIKIGMMATAETVEAIGDVLAANPTLPVVLDPVIASSSGTRLLSDQALERLQQRLLAGSTLITPNLPELALLTGQAIARSEVEILRQARILSDKGCRNVLVKGGHAEGPRAVDILFSDEPPLRFASHRRPGNLRGTGCMLSSAIAANLALGQEMRVATSTAKAFIDAAFDAEIWPDPDSSGG